MAERVDYLSEQLVSMKQLIAHQTDSCGIFVVRGQECLKN